MEESRITETIEDSQVQRKSFNKIQQVGVT